MADAHDRSDAPHQAEVYRRGPGAPVGYGEEREGFSLLQVLTVLIRHRWKVVGSLVAVFLVIGVLRVLSPVTYTSQASFMSQTGGGGGGMGALAGVASRFGISVSSGSGGQSPRFYAALLRTPWLTEQAVTSRYRPDSLPAAALPDGGPEPDVGEAATLVELYGIERPVRQAEVGSAAGRLRENMSVTVSDETGVVTVKVTTPWPAVSQQVVLRLIELVNQFNSQTRQSQASAQAQFIQGRLREIEQELRAAEDSLEQFLERNVGWQQSPELRFEQQRLQRRVDLKQEVFTSLSARYEEARIEEVRSTPVVTTVNPPKVPLGPDGSPLMMQVVLGLIVGVTIGVVWSFGSEFARSVQDEEDEEYREFVSVRQNAAEEVRQASRVVRRLIESGRDRASG